MLDATLEVTVKKSSFVIIHVNFNCTLISGPDPTQPTRTNRWEIIIK